MPSTGTLNDENGIIPVGGRLDVFWSLRRGDSIPMQRRRPNRRVVHPSAFAATQRGGGVCIFITATLTLFFGADFRRFAQIEES